MGRRLRERIVNPGEWRCRCPEEEAQVNPQVLEECPICHTQRPAALAHVETYSSEDRGFPFTKQAWDELRKNTARCIQRVEEERHMPHRLPESYATEKRLRREAVIGTCLLEIYEALKGRV